MAPVLEVRFHATAQGREPVREWLQGLVAIDRKATGPLMVLLHGFVKKSQKTPQTDLELALRRLKEVQNG